MKLRAKSRRRLMVLLGAAVGTLALAAGAYGSLKVYRNHVWEQERTKGLAAFTAHDAASAARELGPYVQRHAGDIPALEAFAAALEQMPGGDALNRGRALGTYERLVTLCPDNLAYRLALTRLYAEAWTWTMPANLEAIRSADELMARFGGHPEAQEAVAEALRVKIAALTRLKKHDAALAAIEQLNEMPAPPNASDATVRDGRAATALARLCEHEGDDTAAGELYRIALQRDPKQSTAQNNLAMVLLRSGEKFDEAEALARAAVEAEPERAEFYDTLALVRRALHNYDDAEAAIVQAIGLDPANPEWLVSRAEILIDAGNLERARLTLDQVAGMPATLSPSIRARYDQAVRRAEIGPKASVLDY